MKKSIYIEVAKQLNSKLPYGSVSIMDTKHIDKQYCDEYSLYLENDVYDMLHEQRDTITANAFFDTVFEVNGNKYYIEPYNSRLHNIAML